MGYRLNISSSSFAVFARFQNCAGRRAVRRAAECQKHGLPHTHALRRGRRLRPRLHAGTVLKKGKALAVQTTRYRL